MYIDEREIQKDDPEFALTVSNELIKINVHHWTVGAMKSFIHKLTDILNIFLRQGREVQHLVFHSPLDISMSSTLVAINLKDDSTYLPSLVNVP